MDQAGRAVARREQGRGAERRSESWSQRSRVGAVGPPARRREVGMRLQRFRLLAAAAVLFAVAHPHAQRGQSPAAPVTEAPEYGPAKGTLVIVGGGNLNGSGISEKFIELAGGPESNFVIVPTAGGNRNADGSLIAYDEQRISAPWVRLGLKHVRVLHTHDP